MKKIKNVDDRCDRKRDLTAGDSKTKGVSTNTDRNVINRTKIHRSAFYILSFFAFFI